MVRNYLYAFSRGGGMDNGACLLALTAGTLIFLSAQWKMEGKGDLRISRLSSFNEHEAYSLN